MKQVAGLISTYSSDEFGICSALYELGGMVVMHDASGCNSTYTTHDEPRWYEMDSMIFISAISEMEAIMGDDDKLIGDLVETAGELHPNFIAVVGAPIPYMIGTDLEAIAAVTERQTGIPCFGFPANGMQNYTKGISMALEKIVERFCIREIPRTKNVSINIIGATPLDFSLDGSVDSMKAWIREEGMEMGACFAMGSTLEEIEKVGQAHVNLVVSYGGLAAAKKLKELFGTPYVVGAPLGKAFANHLGVVVKKTAKTGECAVGYKEMDLEEAYLTASDARTETGCVSGMEDLSESRKKDREEADTDTSVSLAIIGESVYSASLAAAIWMECKIPARVFCPLDTEPELLRKGDLLTPEEDDLLEHLKEAEGVIADPMYRPVCSKNKKFYPLPHEAFSGRIYDAVNPDLVNRELRKVEVRKC